MQTSAARAPRRGVHPQERLPRVQLQRLRHHLARLRRAVGALAEVQPRGPQRQVALELARRALEDEVNAADDAKVCEAALAGDRAELAPRPAQLLQLPLVFIVPAVTLSRRW